DEEAFPWEPRPPRPPREMLAELVAHLGTTGADLLYVNLTPPDMAGLGLYTTRAILPSFQPIDFGWKERRLGGARLYAVPARLGLASAPSTFDSLNHAPHPLA